ncbi:rare lipoprotein A [Rhabdobacter roseus]|uniref:Probable endolytic peptidoglycan transglycosylase RlpA n=1 Tax=Rhabdobacter roseus TaxID=1655419 RepID=A0A840TGR4_9BACT|nr:septal ring lytic transglycosylase RlpA family protein [Rhabdobacter roseus]MBB5282664.1 rare lipoprotein A [Rhabdobacter roseus]
MSYSSFFVFLLLTFSKPLYAQAQAYLGTTETGKASYYATKFNGRKTFFGEKFSSHEFTAAHRTLPHNTMLEVTNTTTQQKVIVRVNDRGPYSKHRLIDISKGAAKELGLLSQGVAQVSVRVVGMEGMVLLDSDEKILPDSGEIISSRRVDEGKK